LAIQVTADGAAAYRAVVAQHADFGVTEVDSAVSEDGTTSSCVYGEPDPEAIRRSAERTGLPVDWFTKVTVLDPYFYQ
jgi:hypothetical protein